MTLRVLAIIDSFSFGGAENLLATLARAAPGAGWELQVASLAPRSQDRNAMLSVLEEAGLRVSFLDVPRLADVTAVPRLTRAIRASGCDVVHAHLGYSAILAPVAARLAGRACVATLHHVPEDLPPRERAKEWLSVRVPARLGSLVLVSEASRREFGRRYPPRGSWRVLHNGVDLTAFSPGTSALPDDVHVPDGALLATMIAALRAPKGHRTAIAAWSDVVAAAPDARLLVVGDGPERARLQQQVAHQGLGEHVLLLGGRADVARLLRASTLAVLPSLTEALPTSLIEAAACGLPVVATDVGGVGEVVQHGRTGILVPPGDTGAFARAVVNVLGDPDRRARMGAVARDVAEDRFDLHQWASRLRDLYEDAARARCPRGPRARRRRRARAGAPTSPACAPPSADPRWPTRARREPAPR
jgi:glycosyltransferase involved in cell wall biosynthesis